MSATKFAGLAFALLSIFGGAAQVAEAQQGKTRPVLAKKGVLHRNSPRLRNGKHYTVYKLNARQGHIYTFALASRQMDTFIWVQSSPRLDLRSAAASNDDFGNGTNSVCEVRCNRSGSMYVVVTTFNPGETGRYTLLVGETPIR